MANIVPIKTTLTDFQHCDSMLPPHTGAGVTGGIGGVSVGPCGGPQGSVDKPFLLHDGRVGLRASLDKGWYTHGEDVQVTVNIRNDSRKTVRKVRVSCNGQPRSYPFYQMAREFLNHFSGYAGNHLKCHNAYATWYSRGEGWKTVAFRSHLECRLLWEISKVAGEKPWVCLGKWKTN